MAAAAGLAVTAPAQPTLSVLPNEQMRADLALSSVSPSGSAWNVTIRVAYDNDNPASFRRWFHLVIGNLDSGGETLNITITPNIFDGSEFIQPVWSLDGGATYERIPQSLGSDPTSYTITTPPGVTEIRFAKYFPYTPAQYDAFRDTFRTDPHVTEIPIGTTALGRTIYEYEITDPSVPATNKERVWIHSAVHPAENTAYFMCEGLINWLMSGTPETQIFMDNIILNIVPMANPDGVALGNYRTNSNSVNLEADWTFPYTSTTEEIVALRTRIETYMGTSATPAPNPIKVLLNLHATHGDSYPFHFVHRPDYNVDGTGVIPIVNQIELDWVAAFRNRSAYVNLGGNSFSSLVGRPFVESMMHDRYTLTGAFDPVMAITFEGVYQRGPILGVPNVPDDYRQVGEEMGFAIADYLGVDLTATNVTNWWMLH